MSEGDKNLVTAVNVFREKFGADSEVAVFAPGRVNLIGEHTDYNDGFVLPFALPFRTIIVGAKSSNGISTIVSCSPGFESSASFEINSSLGKGEPVWANYVKGTVFQYLNDLEAGFAFNAVIISNVPIGSGLSSSASLEVATATFLEVLSGGMPHVSGVERALRAQKAEHTFADTPCGIMDQYISSMGSKGKLLLIDCRTHEYKLITYAEPGEKVPVILVCNSCVKHTLSGSEYPDRVRQCKESVQVIQGKYPQVKSLRDATLEMVESLGPEELLDLPRRRARHVIGENDRTMGVVEALKNKDYKEVGRLMTLSHNSLQDDYEVSCEELDLLVRIANQLPGVYGSRMTGGGFGGCTVSLVDPDHVEAVESAMSENYTKQTGLKCEIYRALPSAGAGVIDPQELTMAKEADKTGVITGQEDRELWSNWVDWVVPVAVVVASAAIYYTRARR
jgi:galactokinase